MTESIHVRALQGADRAAWEALFRGYINFYEAKVPDDVIEVTWQRLLAQQDGLLGLVAVDASDRPIGLAHALFHRSTWSPTTYCYLEDLYVGSQRSPSWNGAGAHRGRVS